MTKIGILGYGNLGKGVELAVKDNDDMELVAVFTRRDPKSVKTLRGTKVVSVNDIKEYEGKIDVLIICGGSATDLPVQTPEYAKIFNVIDSFDTHAKIFEHFGNVDKSAKETNHVALISCGWDPGAFSLNRLMAENFLPVGNTYTFWGTGVSQGHSDAIRRIEGVKNAIQYTVPVEEAMEKVRNGENPELTTREKHIRECYVVLEDGADAARIEKEIKTMPNYFDEYDTTVYFISEEELKKNHSKMPHGGFVIRSGKTGLNNETNQIIEYSLKLESNPEFTSSILVSYARAIHRLADKKDYGCKTVFDIAPALLTRYSKEDLLKHML
jgi:diaminopimelate dehydrogenase